MSGKNTVMLLDSLLAGAEGAEREALSAMYQQAFSAGEDYQALRRMLNETLFTGARGGELFSTGAAALEKGMTKAGSFESASASMRYVLENGRQLLSETNTYIHSLRTDPQRLQLIAKSDADALKALLTALVNEVCYYVTALYGPAPLSGFRFDPAQGALDMLYAVNSGLPAVLNALPRLQAPRVWRIARQRCTGAKLVYYSGVSLHYGDMTIDQMENEMVRKAPFLYYPGRGSELLCAGVGLLTNLRPENGIAALGGSVVTGLDIGAFSAQTFHYAAPDVCALLDRTFPGAVCAVPPAEFVRALNRFLMNAAVATRANGNACPFCGRAGGTCASHFAVPEPEGGFEKLLNDRKNRGA